MSISIENQTDFNPYASPLGSANTQHARRQELLPYRASQATLRDLNSLAIVSDLAYVTVWCCFFATIFFAEKEIGELARIGYFATLFLLWSATVAGLFRAGGLSLRLIETILLLPIPIIGIFFFLRAKESVTEFMIDNGYRPRFLGFAADAPQREAMDQDPQYSPCRSTHLDGSRRSDVYTLGECWIMLGFAGLLLSVLSLFFGCNLIF